MTPEPAVPKSASIAYPVAPSLLAVTVQSRLLFWQSCWEKYILKIEKHLWNNIILVISFFFFVTSDWMVLVHNLEKKTRRYWKSGLTRQPKRRGRKSPENFSQPKRNLKNCDTHMSVASPREVKASSCRPKSWCFLPGNTDKKIETEKRVKEKVNLTPRWSKVGTDLLHSC